MAKDRYSLESITSSIYGSHRTRTSEAATAFAKNGLMPILFEGSESVETYAMAAQESLQEGLQLNMYVDLAMESLASNVRMIKSLKARGVESKLLSLEAIDAKAIIKKTVFAIKTAIQKFITAIGNFIKSISNYVGGQMVKGQEKTWVEATKVGIQKMASNPELAKETINVSIIVGDFSKVMGALPSELLKTVSSWDDVQKNMLSSISKISSNVSKEIKKSTDNKRLPSGKMVAYLMLYGVPDPVAKETKLSDYLKDAKAFEVLSNQKLSEMSKAVKEAKELAAEMNKKVKETDDVAKLLNNPEKTDEAKEKLKFISFKKNLYGMYVQYLLTVYSIFLKERSSRHRALRIALSKQKKADK